MQEEQNGTGHAVRVALEHAGAIAPDEVVVVVPGDAPLLTTATLDELVQRHLRDRAAVTLLSAEFADPTGYGRVVRDPAGAVRAVIEERDADAAVKAVREVAVSVYAFTAGPLSAALARLTTDNAQGEEYLTDVVALLAADGAGVNAHRTGDATETWGVNDRAQLAAAGRRLNDLILADAMRRGVTVTDPLTTWVDVDVELEPDTTLLPGTLLHGRTRVARGAVIGPGSVLTDTIVGARGHGRELDLPGCRDRPGGRGGALHVPASRRAAARRHEGRGVRGDQGVGAGRGREGAAPVLRRRRDDRQADQHRGRNRVLQLRRASASIRRRSATTCASARTRCSSHRCRSATARTPGRGRSSPKTCRPARWGSVADVSTTWRAGCNASAGSGRTIGERGCPRSGHERGVPGLSSLQTPNRKNLMLFSGRAYPELAVEVGAYLGVKPVATNAYEFANGEIFVRFEESARGCDAFVIQSHASPVNEWVMEQLLMVDALKRASAKRITAVLPFYPYARQDKKHRGREPISARLIADLFRAAGAHRLMAVDLHTSQIQGFFDGPVDHLFALPLLAEHVEQHYRGDRLTIVAPDAGRVRVAERWTDRLGCPLAIIHKRRDPDVPNEVKMLEVVGQVAGRTCLIVDDMIDTGGTITKAAEALAEQGATDVVAVSTHAVLSGPAVDRLKNSPISEVVVTNTLPVPDEVRLDKLTVLSIAPLIARAIREVFQDGSVTSLFDGHA